jgi:hypothetical protein
MIPQIEQFIPQVGQFIQDHAAVLSLLALAFICTMREQLPSPFNRIGAFNWLYGWLHDALKVFISLRGPAPQSEKKTP